MKIEVDMTRVGEPTQRMWEYVWKIEEVLGIKYNGPEEFKAVSKWIDEHSKAYGKAFMLREIEYESQFEDGYDYYLPYY